MRELFEAAIVTTGITWRLLAGVAGAESDMVLRAERWGVRTSEALVALQARDDATLSEIIRTEWPDISFGLGQRIVLYHYAGDRTATLANVLAVREAVFLDPGRDVIEMARSLTWRRDFIAAQQLDLSPVGGDLDLAAAVSYNRGSYPARDSGYWTAYAANIQRYREGLAAATAPQ